MPQTQATPATSEPQERPKPIDFDLLANRFGMTRQDVYALALMEALALYFDHQPRQIAPDAWEIDSRSEAGTVRTVKQRDNLLLCNCPAAQGDQQEGRPPRICTHTAAMHLAICTRLGIEPPVRPMPPDVLRFDPSPEARAAPALIVRPAKARTQPAAPAPTLEAAPVLAEVQG